MSMIIELAPYITADKYRGGGGLWDREHGLRAAKDYQLLAQRPLRVVLKIPPGIRMDDSFLKALLGPLARKVGVKNLKVEVLGGHDGSYYSPGYYGRRGRTTTAQQVEEYLHLEGTLIQQRAAEKNKKARGPKWSAPVTFFVPEISTELLLVEDWTFRLYTERRNDALCNQLGIKSDRNWRYENGGVKRHDVTIKGGATMGVSRVYIRQGGSEYSSLTFNLRKGATVVSGGKAFELKKGARFWAKLSDVNKMRVSVDTETLAEN